MDDSFDYQFYVTKYEDLRHMTEEEARQHYIHHGKQEGRVACKNNNGFDYKYYTDTYVDLHGLSEQEARIHYIHHGNKEGRLSCKQVVNHTTNVTIILHLFQTDLFPEMLGYINDVKEVFTKVNVIITVSEHIDTTIYNRIQSVLPNAHLIKVVNKGVDCYPFIVSVQYLRNLNMKTDFILKLHTKTTSNKTEGADNWRQDLILPLVYYNNLVVLQNYFVKMKNIGYVSSQKCVLPKTLDLDYPQNIEGIKQLCDQFPHLEKEWTDFNGGNMFWIANDVLDKYLTEELIQYLIPRFVHGKPPPNYVDKVSIHMEYVCERLFTGPFCYDKNNIFINEYRGTQRGMSVTDGKLDSTYFYQPRIFSVSTPKNVVT